ncbi:hypothetical protein D3H55_02615 [Bacillus salacetis]|uniref:Uncharacterized protein n=1 Tax=Bacillus salacetis TaxID=2315464 RepID=A0A3A1R7J6_9BACI|nr:hypothetical protein D3H55_02615 [Bacillus salacetis]
MSFPLNKITCTSYSVVVPFITTGSEEEKTKKGEWVFGEFSIMNSKRFRKFIWKDRGRKIMKHQHN